MKELKALVRPNILAKMSLPEGQNMDSAVLKVRLDKGELPFNAPYNRFSSEEQEALLTAEVARDKRLSPAAVALVAGSYGATDALLRTFCIPQRDNIVMPEPSPSLFSRLAMLNDIECRKVRLEEDFGLSADRLLAVVGQNTKAILLSSPNYPAGNLFSRSEILRLADSFDGLVVVDETYVEFSRAASLACELAAHPNLVITGNLSAAFASAGLELGYVLAGPDVIRYVQLVKPPHSLPVPAIEAACELFGRRRFDVDKWVKWILEERGKVIAAVRQLPLCERVYPTDAHFFMLKVKDAEAVKAHLSGAGVAVADCSAYPGCSGCLNITIGMKPDNNALLSALRNYK